MTELQNRANVLRTFYGLSNYGFTSITAGETSLGGWTSHVNEIRAAVDEICEASGKEHETWQTIPENRPSVSVMQQLRDTILSL